MTRLPQPPALKSLLDNRDQRIGPHYCYKLQGPSAQYGLDVTFPDEGMDIDESSMSVVIPFASGLRRDGVGDLLEVGGIRTERHQKNPIVLFDHGKEVKLPIAMAMDRQTKEYTVHIDPVSQSAWCKAFFYNGKGIEGVDRTADFNHAVFCEQLFDLIAQGYIRGGSIGYQVVKALELPPDYERGIPKGLHLLSTLMLEASAVVMPANQDTVRKGLDWGQTIDFWNKNTIETAREILAMPSVCGKSLSPVLVKTLEGYTKARYVDKQPERYGLTLDQPPDHTEKIGGSHFAAQGGHVVSGKPHATREGAANSAIRHGLRDTLKDEIQKRQGKEMEQEDKAVDESKPKSRKTQLAKPAVDQKPATFFANVPARSDAPPLRIPKARYQDKAAEEIKPAKQNQRRVSGGIGKSRTSRVSEPQKGSDDELKNTRKPTQLKKELKRPQSQVKTELKKPPMMADARAEIASRGKVQQKYLSARKKYRKTKSLRRKIKSGRAGAAIVYVGTKEFEAAKDNASQKGIKLQHMGEFKGSVKLKLTGDDGAIDDFAKEYGRNMRMGTKSLDNQIPTREQVQKEFDKLRKKLSQSQALAEVEKQYGITHTTINGQGIVTSFETLGSQSLDPHAKDIGENMATKSAKPTKLASSNPKPLKGKKPQRSNTAPPLRVPKDEVPDHEETHPKKGIDQYEAKAMEDEVMQEEMTMEPEPAAEPEADIDVAADQGQQEKYGAQVLRRLHQDAAILLGEYDDFINLLESDKVSKLLTGKLEHLVDMLEEIEGLFAAEYPEAAPLEGFDTFDETPNDMGPEGEEVVEEAVEETTEGDEKDGDDVGVGIEMDDRGERAVAGDSDEEYIEDEETAELPSEMEEDVEEESWAETKNLKSLRAKYKSHSGERGEKGQRTDANQTGYNEGEFRDSGGELRGTFRVLKRDRGGVPSKVATSRKPKYPGGRRDVTEGAADERTGKGPGSRPMRIPKEPTTHVPKKGFEEIADQESETCEGCGQEQCQCEPEEIQQEIADSFASHEKASIGEAAGFLGQLSTEMNYGDEHRMNSWHYHKTLDGIVSLREANEMLNEGTDIPPAEWEPGAGAKNVGIHVPKIKKPVQTPKNPGDSQVDQPTRVAGGPRQGSQGEQLENDWEQASGNPMGFKGEMKMCKDASSFFRELSQTRDFGDPHREKCKYWHRNLEPLSKEEDIDEEDIEEEMENGDEEVMEENEEMEVGERGEKASVEDQESVSQYGMGGEYQGERTPATRTPYKRSRVETAQGYRAVPEKVSGKRPGPGARPMRIPKEPTTHQPKKSIPEVSEKSIADQLAANAKAMEELNRTLLSLN